MIKKIFLLLFSIILLNINVVLSDDVIITHTVTSVGSLPVIDIDLNNEITRIELIRKYTDLLLTKIKTNFIINDIRKPFNSQRLSLLNITVEGKAINILTIK